MLARIAVFSLAILSFTSPARALTADDLLLIVNKNEPAGMELAQHYAKVRNVPDGRIVQVDVPAWNEIPSEQFERDVAEPVRVHLRKNELTTRVKCLVTFYGMPLRVAGHKFNEFDASELKAVTANLGDAEKALADVRTKAQALVKKLGATVEVPTGAPLDPAVEIERSLNAAGQAAERLPDAQARSKALGEVFDLLEQAAGDVGSINRLRSSNVPPSTRPVAQKTDALTLELDLRNARKELDELIGDRNVRNSRVSARKLSKRFGLIAEIGLLRAQQQWLTPGDTRSALDNELPLIMLGGYPRDRWLGNPLYFARPRIAGGPPVYMVTRIDGPTVDIARGLIDTAIATETTGLKGNVIVDQGPSLETDKPNTAYAAYDRSLATYANFLKEKTTLPLTFDQKRALIPPNTVNDIGLYVGWYSLRHYRPPGTFARGAVGYHIASAELVTLRDAEEKGWCKGMLTDGVIGTLGAVAEPYLHAFPQPQEFFPLLLTGRLTFAEVYWRTNPLTSWMIAVIGDPLYNPYKVAPVLEVKDLPENLRKVFEG